jgi:hypothetical protein
MKYDDIDPDLELHRQPGPQRPADEPVILFAHDPVPVHRSRALPIALTVLALAAIAGGGYFGWRQWNAPAALTPAASTTPPPLAGTVVEDPLGDEAAAITIPPLGESDEAVRELVRALSSHPTVAAWLTTDGLIRNFTVVVSNIANGEPMLKQVTAIRPRGSFQVEEQGEDLAMAERSSARYLPVATAASSIDPAGAARLYATLKPRITEAYRELGYPDTPFDQTLERAIVLLLRTPVPSGRVALHPAGGTSYRFADPALEKLTHAQKALIRMGPENQRAVQGALRRIALALGIPEDRLPHA